MQWRNTIVSDPKYTNKVNDKEFEIGQVVFFVKDIMKKRCGVDWGIVDEYWHDGYGLSLYEVVDDRLVNGIPIKEFPFDNIDNGKDGSKKKKLPKNWSYDTKLFAITYDSEIEDLKHSEEFKFTPETINRLIEVGLLVKPSTQFAANKVEANIDRDGYTLSLRLPVYEHSRTDHAVVLSDNIFATYDEAYKVIDDYYTELERQAALSDYDWVVEQIDKKLDRYKGLYHATESDCAKIREFLLKQEDVEEIEVRIIGEGFQWKYVQNKRWNTIVLDNGML